MSKRYSKKQHTTVEGRGQDCLPVDVQNTCFMTTQARIHSNRRQYRLPWNSLIGLVKISRRHSDCSWGGGGPRPWITLASCAPAIARGVFPVCRCSHCHHRESVDSYRFFLTVTIVSVCQLQGNVGCVPNMLPAVHPLGSPSSI